MTYSTNDFESKIDEKTKPYTHIAEAFSPILEQETLKQGQKLNRDKKIYQEIYVLVYAKSQRFIILLSFLTSLARCSEPQITIFTSWLLNSVTIKSKACIRL